MFASEPLEIVFPTTNDELPPAVFAHRHCHDSKVSVHAVDVGNAKQNCSAASDGCSLVFAVNVIAAEPADDVRTDVLRLQPENALSVRLDVERRDELTHQAPGVGRVDGVGHREHQLARLK